MSFLKGFTNLFDWMFPKTYQEMSDDLDNQMQELYDRNGWGKYNNPLQGYQNAVDINRVLEAEKQFHNSIDDHWYAKYLRGEPVEYHGSIADLEKLISSYKPGSFIPYSIYDESDGSVTAHFKDGEYVSILLNDNITVFKSFYGSEIIGCRINNLKKVKNETNK